MMPKPIRSMRTVRKMTPRRPRAGSTTERYTFRVLSPPDAIGPAEWGDSRSVPQLGAAEVHVWAARVSPADRQRRVLREILADYLDTPAESIRFVYGPNGKPELAPDSPRRLHFNLTHTTDLALIAVSATAEVGVDVEAIAPMEDMDDVAAAQFSGEERQRIAARPIAEQPKAFFEAWTRKEASIKARGGNLSDESRPDWIRAMLEPEPGYVGAVASPKDLKVRCFRWCGT